MLGCVESDGSDREARTEGGDAEAQQGRALHPDGVWVA